MREIRFLTAKGRTGELRVGPGLPVWDEIMKAAAELLEADIEDVWIICEEGRPPLLQMTKAFRGWFVANKFFEK